MLFCTYPGDGPSLHYSTLTSQLLQKLPGVPNWRQNHRHTPQLSIRAPTATKPPLLLDRKPIQGWVLLLSSLCTELTSPWLYSMQDKRVLDFGCPLVHWIIHPFNTYAIPSYLNNPSLFYLCGIGVTSLRSSWHIKNHLFHEYEYANDWKHNYWFHSFFMLCT